MIEICSLAFSLKPEDLNQKLISYLVLKEEIQTKAWSGFSACYALSEYMVHHFPKVNFTLDPSKTPQIIPDQKQESEYLSYHPLLQFWADLFQRTIVNGNAVRVQNKIYILVNLKKQQFQQFDQQSQLFKSVKLQNYENLSGFEAIQKLFALKKVQKQKKKVGFVVVGPIQFNTDIYKPVMNASSLLIGSIYNNQNWKKISILTEEVPSVQFLKQFDVLIMPGSNYSVLELHQPIDLYIKRALQAFKQSQKLKMIGICYSHQLLSLKEGVQVVKKTRTKGLQTIQFEKQILQKYDFLEPIKNYKQPLMLDQFHQDYVEQIPQNYQLLAHSNSSKIEGLIHKSGRIITFQFHPEYQHEFDLGFELRYRKYHKLIDQPWVYKKPSQQHLQIHKKSVKVLRQCLRRFIDY